MQPAATGPAQASLAVARPSEAPDRATIALRLDAAAQILEAAAPSPFRDDDPLRPEAAAWILRKARGLPRNAPLAIRLSLPPEAAAAPEAARIAPAIAGHFAALAASEDKAMSEHMADGARAALVGLLVFAGCLAVAWRLYATLADYPFARIVRESFVILGWVAMWKPVEMLLHERLPIARRRRLYRRLAEAEITLRAEPAA